PIVLPPLRDRPEDLLDLADAFLNQAARRQDRAVTRIAPEAETVLLRHRWPGNVRELKNVMERAVVLAESDTVTIAELPAELRPLRDAETPAPTGAGPAERAVPRPAATSHRAASPASPDRLLGVESGRGGFESRTDIRFPDETAADRRPSDLRQAVSPPPVRLTPAAERNEANRRKLIAVLEKCEGNKSKAARQLGLPRSTFYSRLQKHGIVP
ncbi:MAG: helix-turn-helix domain-containing protein, partial [Planctomycetota bacterium]